MSDSMEITARDVAPFPVQRTEPLTVADLDEAAQAIPAEEYLECEFCDERVNPHLFSEHRNTHVRKSAPTEVPLAASAHPVERSGG